MIFPVLKAPGPVTRNFPGEEQSVLLEASLETLEPGGKHRFIITGDGFLRHMVRNIVGTILEVGKGKLAQSDIGAILAAKDRSAAGPTAPAVGLFLKEVFYS